ncbi:MAG: DUF6923 family protein [Niabella sp.]
MKSQSVKPTRTILFVLVLLLPFYTIAQLPAPFTACSKSVFQVVNGPSTAQVINPINGSTTSVVTYPFSVNGIGYNPIDSRIYGIGSNTAQTLSYDTLIVIGENFSYSKVPISGFSLNTNGMGITVGDVNANQELYIKASGNRLVKVDVNPSSGTFGQATSVGNITNTATYNVTGDWAFLYGETTTVYGIDFNTHTVVKLDVTAGTLSFVSTGIVLPDAGQYGAVFVDASGNFYAKNNTTGNIFKVSNITTTPTYSLYTTSTASTLNDGARCPNAPEAVMADYSDAPISYSTYSGNNGPEHIAVSASTFDVRIGAALTLDADGLPSTTSNLDTDDGISSFPAIAGGNVPNIIPSYTVIVPVTNNTANSGQLDAWIDWNNNGVFDAGELHSATVPANTTTNITFIWVGVTLTGPTGTPGTYARFRISTDPTNFGSPVGVSSNGEVEDYYIPFNSPLPIMFGPIDAGITGNVLNISWSTLFEKNNNYFRILLSTDGKKFTEIGVVDTKNTGGNSNTLTTYSFNTLLPASTTTSWLLGVIILIIVPSVLMRKKKYSLWLIAAMLINVSLLFVSCKNNLDQEFLTKQDKKLFIKIVQVDIDGTETGSRIISVIKHD